MIWILAAYFFVQSILAAGQSQVLGVLISATLTVLLVTSKYTEVFALTINRPINLREWANYRPASAGGWVYIIRDVEISGFYKIGKTHRPFKRMKTFAVKLPFRTELIHVIPSDDAGKLESKLHQLYAKHRKRGEWFDLPASVIKDLKQYGVTKNDADSFKIRNDAGKIVGHVCPGCGKELSVSGWSRHRRTCEALAGVVWK